MASQFIPVVVRDGVKTFTVLENNPQVMTTLAHKLGVSKTLEFHDVYSLTDPDLLNLIPRPAYALLIKTSTTTHLVDLKSLSFGSSKLLDMLVGASDCYIALSNGEAANFIEKGSILEKLKNDVLPLGMNDRAQHLYENKEFEISHQSVAAMGDTAAPSAEDGDRLGQHFVAFVKGADGHLYELEGSRKGPLDRGLLDREEDVLSPRAIELGIGRVIALDKAAGGDDLRFSVTALSSMQPHE